MGKVCCLRRRKLSPHIDITNTTYLLASSNLDQSRTQDLLWLLWHPRSQFLKLIFTWNWMTDMTSLYALYGKYYYWMYWSKRSFRFIECQGEILGSIIFRQCCHDTYIQLSIWRENSNISCKWSLEQRIYWCLFTNPLKAIFRYALSVRFSSSFEKWQDNMDAISTNLSSTVEFLIAT